MLVCGGRVENVINTYAKRILHLFSQMNPVLICQLFGYQGVGKAGSGAVYIGHLTISFS